MNNHDRGQVAVYVSCSDREKLAKLQQAEGERTGYPITLKALLSRLITQGVRVSK